MFCYDNIQTKFISIHGFHWHLAKNWFDQQTNYDSKTQNFSFYDWKCNVEYRNGKYESNKIFLILTIISECLQKFWREKFTEDFS